MRYVLYIDLDGTIAVSPISLVIKEAYKRIAEASERKLQEVEAISWRIHIELVKRSSPKAFDWDFIGQEVSRVLGISPVFNVEKRFRELCHLSHLLDDAARVLAELDDVGRIMILATNGLLKYQKCVIESLGLDKYFDMVFTPDTRSCLKNSKAFYSIEEGYSNGVSVGDNYTFDVYYPKKFGLKAIHIVRSPQDPYASWIGIKRHIEPDATTGDLRELLKLLKML